jgi:hypothetical protein
VANLKNKGEMVSPMIYENLKWMTVKEAATYLRRTEGAMKNLIYRGKVRVRKWAGRVYVNRGELDSSIESGLL